MSTFDGQSKHHPGGHTSDMPAGLMADAEPYSPPDGQMPAGDMTAASPIEPEVGLTPPAMLGAYATPATPDVPPTTEGRVLSGRWRIEFDA